VGAPNTQLTRGVIVTTPAQVNTSGLTMGYFDGNTVTALWNYAQHYALSDRFFGATFGPSTIGAINLISGQTNGAVSDVNATSALTPDGYGNSTLYVDDEPTDDLCSTSGQTLHMTGQNIGDLLTAAGVTWGWFQGGFNLTLTNPAITAVTPNVPATTGCNRATYSAKIGIAEGDYVPRHEPFQFYPSTANPLHLRPTSTAAIGTNADVANHQYDTQDFLTALSAGNMPAVSFLKPPAYQDSHASNSDPLDEQTWLVTMINAIESSPFWPNTAIIVAYDDSDGWYDHVTDVVNGSNSPSTPPVDSAICSGNTGSTTLNPNNALPGVASTTLHAQGRCGHGPRLPLLVISPWANKNSLDSTPIDQTSITRFVEDTFLGGQRIGGGSYDAIAGSLNNLFNFNSSTAPNPNVVLLNPATGVVTSGN
jgi:phospholipase C